MEKEQNNIPKIGDKGVFEVKEDSTLRASEDFKGCEQTIYKDLDIENAPESKDKKEWYGMLGEERVLREPLNKIDIWQKSLQEVVKIVRDNNLVGDLLKWSEVHMRNKAIQMKRKDSDVLIVPATQTLLEAAEIIQIQQEK
ncbi:hypothetical protein KKF60_01410 [Patescibacteria group bacterium]|nr:hypothetical protein [Patescibacteria group bacterium]MBU4458543.1 hypothetical protein [Patescibacteria group bacterium]MCG2696316.1 hypothetical protein [Candidatus Portnoybacteria bacterium]